MLPINWICELRRRRRNSPIANLVNCHPISASVGRKPPALAFVDEGSILFDGEDADRTCSRIQSIKKLAVAVTARSRFVLAAGLIPNIVAPTGARRLLGPMENPEIVDEPAFRDINKTAVCSARVPAICVAQSWHSNADRREGRSQ
jgi:hypothetical protein